jgi:hypothetical protein
MDALLQLKGIDKSFPGVKALSGAALNVYGGRVMALVGENGAGKSTMMKVLTGIYASIFYFRRSVDGLGHRCPALGQFVGWVRGFLGVCANGWFFDVFFFMGF